jgi:hypothetical protein
MTKYPQNLVKGQHPTIRQCGHVHFELYDNFLSWHLFVELISHGMTNSFEGGALGEIFFFFVSLSVSFSLMYSSLITSRGTIFVFHSSIVLSRS